MRYNVKIEQEDNGNCNLTVELIDANMLCVASINDELLRITHVINSSSPETPGLKLEGPALFSGNITSPFYEYEDYKLGAEVRNLSLPVANVIAENISVMVDNERMILATVKAAAEEKAAAEAAADALPKKKRILLTRTTPFANQNKVQAIKALRRVTDMGLKEAKDTVEAIMDGIPQKALALGEFLAGKELETAPSGERLYLSDFLGWEYVY